MACTSAFLCTALLFAIMFWMASVISVLHTKDQESIDLLQWESMQCDSPQFDSSQYDDSTTDDNGNDEDISDRESTASWLWFEIFPSMPQSRLFQLWVRAFHWNFAQYLPAYIQWRAYIDITAVPTL